MHMRNEITDGVALVIADEVELLKRLWYVEGFFLVLVLIGLLKRRMDDTDQRISIDSTSGRIGKVSWLQDETNDSMVTIQSTTESAKSTLNI